MVNGVYHEYRGRSFLENAQPIGFSRAYAFVPEPNNFPAFTNPDEGRARLIQDIAVSWGLKGELTRIV